MKISTASKKVLASALSAAMVVAFAPTLALAKPSSSTPQGTMVSVTYEANGGTVDTGKTLAGDYAAVVADNTTGHKWIQLGVAANNLTIVKKGAAATGWFVDTDGDGVKGATETAVEVTSSGSSTEYWLDLTAAGVADESSVVLKASYTESTLGNLSFTDIDSSKNVYDADGDNSADAPAATITVPVTAQNAIAGHTYKLTVTNPDGTVVGEKTWAPDASGAATVASGNQTVYFTANPTSTDKMAAYSSMLVSGEYTATLTDNGAAISSKKAKLAEITYNDADGKKIKSEMVQLSNGSADVNLGSDAWVNAAGDTVTGTVTVTGPTTYTKASNAAADVAKALTLGSYTPGTGVDAAGSFTYAVSAISTPDTGTYAVALTDPAGNTVYSANGTTSTNVTVSFDPTAAGARTTASEQAGTYSLTLSYTKDGVTTTAKKSFTLTQVKFEAGEHGSYGKKTQTSFFTTEPSTKTIANGDKAKADATNAVSPTVDDGYTFKEWTLNGAALSNKNNVKAGEVNTYTATYNAKAYAEAATWSIEKTTVGTTDYYTLTVTAPTGTKASVAKDSSTYADYTAPIVMTKAEFETIAKISVKTESTATVSKPEDKVITLVNAAKKGATASDEWKALTSGGSNKLETQVGATGTKWMAVSGVASAIEAGKTVAEGLVAKNLVEQTEYNAAMADAEKAVYEAVAAEADAQVAAYDNEALVIAGKKVYKMSAADYKTASAAYASAKKAAEKDLAAVKTKTSDSYQTAANAYIGAASDFLTAANASKNEQSITPADFDAAAAVDAQIAKVASDYADVTAENYEAALDAADAAQASYDALTADQKKLVTANPTSIAKVQVAALNVKADEAQKAADAAKAEAEQAKTDKAEADKKAEAAQTAAAEAAAQAKAAQDELAAATAKGASKTVKASKKTKKTAKAYSLSVSAADSKSGEAATTSKVSASKGLTVSGKKVTLKKGAKKGTYTAKVKVTYGEYSSTVKVAFKVK